LAKLFVDFALWRLWPLSLGETTLPGNFVANILFLLVIPGGVVDFFPIHNTGCSEVTYKNDSLIDWLKKNTKPLDIFVTDLFVNHTILMAGRRVLYGWPYYGWSACYNASKYDRLYTDLFENKDPWKVYHLLKENGISYVAYDNAVQQGQFIKRPNQQLYATYFPKVFEDSRYNGLVIYKVPDTAPPKLRSLPESATNMFEGGKGTGKGEFDLPTGIAVDLNGNVLVADTNNGRIEKFSPTGGAFLSTIANKGSGRGQLGEPNGIAIDSAGTIYVAEVCCNHRVQKRTTDGTSIAECEGPAGCEDLAIDSKSGRLYASSANIDAVLIVDLNGTRLGSLTPKPPDRLEGPSALTLANGKLYVLNMYGNRISAIDL